MADYYKGSKRVLDEDEVLSLIKQYSGAPPTGTIVASLAVTVPDGWLLCDGSQVPRDDYYDLWVALGKPDIIAAPEDSSDSETEDSGIPDRMDSASEISVADSTTEDWVPEEDDVEDVSTVYMFELPDLRNRFLQGTGDTALGTAVEAGLPNIKGSFMLGGDSNVTALSSSSKASGAFAKGPVRSGGSYENAGANWTVLDTIDFIASYSNSIYGSSDTVQPPSTVVNWLIKT